MKASAEKEAGETPALPGTSTEQDFLNAAFPEPVRLLGQELEAYSVAHDMLLRQHENLFVCDGRNGRDGNDGITADRIVSHLFMGVFICAHRWPEVTRALRSPELGEISREWRRKAEKESKSKAGDKVTDKVAWEVEKVREFRRYIDEGRAFPAFDPVKRRGMRRHRGGAPWMSQLITTLTGPLNFTLADAYNCPFGLAHWLYLTHWENEGTVRIKTREEERQLRAQEKEVHAAAEKQGLKVMRFAKGKYAEGVSSSEFRVSGQEKQEGTEKTENAGNGSNLVVGGTGGVNFPTKGDS